MEGGRVLLGADRRGRRAVLGRHPAAQRHRLAAHGPRAQQHDPGRRRPALAHDGPPDRCGSSAPTTPASPRRTRSSRSSREEGLSRHDVGREEFIEACWDVAPRVRRHDHRASSRRWAAAATTTTSASRWTRTTSVAVRKVFVDWFDAGLIYRGKRIINWCPRCSTALSDIEVEHEDVDSHLWHLRYPLKEPVGGIDHVDRGDHASRDDARRHVRRRAPGRRALRGARGRDRRAAAHGPRDPDRRRRLRRPRRSARAPSR